MKKFAFLLLFALVCAGTSGAANVDLGVNINLSNHSEPPAYPPPPVPPAPPKYVEPEPFVVSVVPQFVIVPRLGFYVSIESPFDMFYIDDVYYMYRNDRWYLSDYYDGPWRVAEPRRLPPGLRKYRYQQMIDWRNREYELYRRDRDHYRDRYYRPERRDDRDRARYEKEMRERYEKDREYEREQYKKEREQYEKERERDREAYEKARERERERHEKEREQYEKERERHDKKPGRGHGSWKHDD